MSTVFRDKPAAVVLEQWGSRNAELRRSARLFGGGLRTVNAERLPRGYSPTRALCRVSDCADGEELRRGLARSGVVSQRSHLRGFGCCLTEELPRAGAANAPFPRRYEAPTADERRRASRRGECGIEGSRRPKKGRSRATGISWPPVENS